MSDVVIRAEGLGKKYRIGHQAGRERYASLREVIARNARNLGRSVVDLARGRAGVAGDEVEEFWALRDLDFEIRRGEVVGVIGRNGAGKSTLLKVLSRITEPTEGRVEIRGRVASLLEVGAGVHPELSGRENIYLNGAVLGMSQAEIRRKFDEIVAFAEVEKFLDTPVKRYSSGMYVRLGFAVAAHLEPEILIVDEVLAVGDADFQTKCLGKMGEVASQGRTVLFVSHSLGALTSICETGLLLSQGRANFCGSIGETVKAYRSLAHGADAGISAQLFEGPLKDVLSVADVAINGLPLSQTQCVFPGQPIEIVVRGHAARRLDDFRLGVSLFKDGVQVLTLNDGPEALREGAFASVFRIPPLLLRPGEYWLAIGGHQARSSGDWLYATNLASVEVLAQWTADYDRTNTGVVNIPKAARRISPAAADKSFAR